MNTVLAPDETHESKALYNQAIEMLSRSHVDTALKRLEEALQIAPNNPTYLSHYGLCVALEKADFDSALKLCTRALKIDPKSTLSQVNLGRVYKLQGETSTAYNTFLRAWKGDKSHPAPATELSRMGIRRPPVLSFLPRSHWLNIRLGRLRARVERAV